jgi:hypothetical protein
MTCGPAVRLRQCRYCPIRRFALRRAGHLLPAAVVRRCLWSIRTARRSELTTTASWNAEAPSEAFRALVLAGQRASIEVDSDGCCIILDESGVDDCWLMIVAVCTLAGLCKGPDGEPGAREGLSDVLRAELLTLTSSGSVRLAQWRARPCCARRAVCVVEP